MRLGVAQVASPAVEIIRAFGPCPPPEVGAAVTIGAYDGVHLGHRAVVAEVRRRADELGVRSAVVTFDRHPAMVVRPESRPGSSPTSTRSSSCWPSTGVDATVVVPFDEARAAESAEDFVHEVVIGCLAAEAVVVGEDFHFGHHRRGNLELLRRMGAEAGFTVEGLGLRSARDVGAEAAAIWADASAAVGGEAPEVKVSSTAIRQALVAGDLAAANDLLGRPHEVRGLVTTGDQRGRELGFPTANVAVPGEILLPADGIYAGWSVRPDGSGWPTAISLGRRPTFYEQAHASLLEAHLLDFSGDLYGEHLAVRFVARLRGEERFDSVDALIAQIARDCDDARALLAP